MTSNTSGRRVTNVPTASDFIRGHALSESVQPNLERLFKVLLDPAQEITFFVGAGASVDAGYHTWNGLLDALCERIEGDRIGELARDDRDGPLRGAETILRLIAPTTPATDAEVLRDVLYQGHLEPR